MINAQLSVANNVNDIDDLEQQISFDAEFAAKQFVYQLKSLIFYPLLYGFEQQDSKANTEIIRQTVKMFLARYQV